MANISDSTVMGPIKKNVFLKEYTLSKDIYHYRAILISWNHFRKIRDKALSKVVESCNYLIWESFSFIE